MRYAYEDQIRRLRLLALLILAAFILLLARLAWLQLVEGQHYKTRAEQNSLRMVTVQAPRGTIYDRNGAVLVASRPSFAVVVTPAAFTSGTASELLGIITGLTTADINRMVDSGRDMPLMPVYIKRDVDAAVVAKVEEHKDYLPGVAIAAAPVRQYVYNQLAAHVLGYLGAISATEYQQRQGQGYRPDDFVGQAGLEQVYETVLRGVNGGQQIEVNAQGQQVRILGDKTALPGKSLVLTLDANLQKAAEDALDSALAAGATQAGAVVALDTKSGAVLAWASRPAFNPNLFAAGISSKDWQTIVNNTDDPLSNRVIQNTYPPGSVFKIVTASAALELGLTTPTEVFNDQGVYVLNGWTFYGWEPRGLGRLTLVDALALSSDPVFYELGRRLGPDHLADYAHAYGFGAVSGVELPGEVAGTVPTAAWKEAQFGEPWYPGESIIAAIGQGYYLVTPLQQALMLEAVANRGVVYKPYLVDKILNSDASLYLQNKPVVLRNVNLRASTWDTVQAGLRAVVQRGTGEGAFAGFPLAVAGKTGSAETGQSTTHAWFACYAPADAPAIVVAAFVENGGEGAAAAAPVARRVLEAYFGIPGGVVQPPPGGKLD